MVELEYKYQEFGMWSRKLEQLLEAAWSPQFANQSWYEKCKSRVVQFLETMRKAIEWLELMKVNLLEVYRRGGAGH
jgi:hypothetical protein